MKTQDWLIPGAIIAVCLGVVAITWLVTRERRQKWDLSPRDDSRPTDPTPVEAAELAAWHDAHGVAVANWIAEHERRLSSLSAQRLKVDINDTDLTGEHEVLDPDFQTAIASHPVPAMRAELSAMQVAGSSAVRSVRRGDYRAAERHHLTYLEYRKQWVERLRQFAQDDEAVEDLRSQGRETRRWAPVDDTAGDERESPAEPTPRKDAGADDERPDDESPTADAERVDGSPADEAIEDVTPSLADDADEDATQQPSG